MDTIAQPSGAESYSDRPMESQDAWYVCSGPDSDWSEGEMRRLNAVDCILRDDPM